MEELEQLRIFIEGGDMNAALTLLDELDDMNRDAPIHPACSSWVSRYFPPLGIAYRTCPTVEPRL
jgi:hypothetical protein